MTSLTKSRIDSIDILRGIVMVIMALDHVRDFFHIFAFTDDPLNLATTTPYLYSTRWITHFCAPTFVFLSGVSIYLQSLRKTKKELSVFLIKRGLWLIFVEFIIISFAWSFNPLYNFHFLQVIWAIGICMFVLGFLVYLPFNYILTIGLLIVLGHNLLDIPEAAPDFKATFLWDLLHHGFFAVYSYTPNHSIIIVYPFLAWLGLMILGYCAGVFFTDKFSVEKRNRLLVQLGVSITALFVVIRFINIYGDPSPWTSQPTSLNTFFSFMNVTKYPPSLMFMCITIGPALILLSFLENIKNAFTTIMRTFGRTAFFYYVLHFYLIHSLAVISFFIKGHTFKEGTVDNQIPFLFVLPGEGYGLIGVYLIWLFVVISLYPLCKWYDRYKSAHKEKWWLSYL